MNRRRRTLALLCLLLAVIAVKVGQQVYRWYAYEDERVELRRLTERLEDAGFTVVLTQVAADSLRERIEGIDLELSDARGTVAAYDRFALDGSLPATIYDAYRGDLDALNRRVGARNRWFEEWKTVVARNHAAVGSYNALVDSMRSVAARMGEPYISIPSPAEIASRRGYAP